MSRLGIIPSESKQKLIDNIIIGNPEIGERVEYPETYISSYRKDGRYIHGIVKEINGDVYKLQCDEYRYEDTYHDVKREEIKRNTWNIGKNPFDTKHKMFNTIAFTFESIIFHFELLERRRQEPIIMSGIEVKEVNWNPYIYNKDGMKEYYQRDFVWTIEDKRLLIDSIYKGINCGLILVREHSWDKLEKMAKNGETELAFKDIVDGKQRLNAIKGFINNEYTDSYGNYFNDLSDEAQLKFVDHQLFQYAELKDISDEETIYQFLKLNFAGVPQSKEHIEFVTSISERLSK